MPGVKGISTTTNADGTVTITWAEDADGFAGATVNFGPVNIEGFKYVIVETVGAATTNFNVQMQQELNQHGAIH